MNKAHTYLQPLTLGLILVLGLALRMYNLNFPSIGYHNMKENEYLSMAEEMRRTGDFVTRRIYFYNPFAENVEMKIFPQPPLVSYQTLAAWKLFGENLWGPRLCNVVFGLLSIVVMFCIALLLFKDAWSALYSAFLLAIMPLAVFFSRNLQPESPGFFFMLLGSLFYLKFVTTLKRHHLSLGGLAFSLAWMYKFTFLFGILPFVFCLPLKPLLKDRRGFLKYCLAFFLPYLVILFTVVWLKIIGQWEFSRQSTLGRIRLFDIFSPGYWIRNGAVIWWYITDENYGLLFTLLAVLGVAAACVRRNDLVSRYITGWAATILPYSMVFSDFINQHNYYQMPFLGMACIACVYALMFLTEKTRRFFMKKTMAFFTVFYTLIALVPAYNSISRMYARFYPGEDVAGASLKEFTAPEERVFLLTFCQGYGIARYAQRYMGWPENLEDFKKKEDMLKVRYICVYPANFLGRLEKNSPEWFNYIQRHYHLKEVGTLSQTNQWGYFILEKGKGQNIQKALDSFSGRVHAEIRYRIPGREVFFYAIRSEGVQEVQDKPPKVNPAGRKNLR